MEKNRSKKSGIGMTVLALMLGMFSIMKVVRGSDTTSTAQGGFWNYIAVLYYIVFVVLILAKRLRIFGTIGWLFAYATIATIVSIVFFPGLNINNVYLLLMVPYPTLVSYCFFAVKKGSRTSEIIILVTYFVCLAINAYTILRYQFFGARRPFASDIYFSLCLLPFALVFIKQKGLKITIIIAELLLVFLSAKRAGTIALIVGLIFYWWIDTKHEETFSKKLWKVIIAVLLLLVLYEISKYIDNAFNLGLFNRLSRLSEDQGSGRLTYYGKVYQAFKDSKLVNKIFGHGMYATGNFVSLAHNDLLEALYDYGILSCFCLIMFFVSLIKNGIRLISENSSLAPAFALSVVIGLFLSMFSFFMIYYTYVTCMAAFWGFCLGTDNCTSLQKKV